MITDQRGRVIGVKPLKEAVRLSESPEEVCRHLDSFVAGGLRGGAYEPEEAAA
jgi:hypothetical protein